MPVSVRFAVAVHALVVLATSEEPASSGLLAESVGTNPVVIRRLLGMNYQERASNNCISVERADLVLAGCAILEALLRTWPCQRLRVADRGLREGILAMLMAEDGHHRRGRHP